MTPSKAQKALAVNMKERRLALNLTQSGLSERCGVRLGTLRNFERMVQSLLKIYPN
ncbi:MAG: helix-turn-helix transcriptional regulator [Bacteroidetes bacterium]|nr:helix-turn-helix transcriptional regulator [Bacteroidota bacterium]MCY4232911.1 helix-turn-helix transcriptional regulator [Bacteroidota bacterium]